MSRKSQAPRTKANSFDKMSWTQPEMKYTAGLFNTATVDDRFEVKALVESILGPGRYTPDTNNNCALLLNLCGLKNASKYPDLVPCYESLNGKLPRIQNFHLPCSTTVFIHSSQQHSCYAIHTDGLLHHSDFNAPGLFLYIKQFEDIPKPLKARKQDLKNRNGEVVECDPDFPLCLAYFMPSGTHVTAQDNKHAYRLHISGNNNLLENENVVFRHANHFKGARSDKRITGRCCFRYRVRATADALEPTAGANESTKDPPKIMSTANRSFEEAQDMAVYQVGANRLLRSVSLAELDSVWSCVPFADKSNKDKRTQASCSMLSDGIDDLIDSLCDTNDVSHLRKKHKGTLAPPGSNWACCLENSHLPAAKRHKFTNEQVMVTVTHDGQDHVTAANAVSNAALLEYFMELQEE